MPRTSSSMGQLLNGTYSDRICVSVYGRDFAQLSKNVSLAQSFGAGFVELRLDYLSSPLTVVTQLRNFIDHKTSWILTFRSPGECGVNRISEKLRKEILLKIISEVRPPFIDIELETLETFSEVQDALRSNSGTTELIASSHDFRKTEDSRGLKDLITKTARRYNPSIIKIVRHAKDFKDNLTMLSLYRLVETKNPAKLVAFCMGPLGMYSRIACVSYGSPFTYAALPGQETASGQLDAQSMQILLNSWEVK